ncbi:MAG: Asp-tRNA(Asn)/Glu-tRNA(Gln) amidotransferase GatCAB subunit A, partial [Candidatus Dadabacteria bacterium]
YGFRKNADNLFDMYCTTREEGFGREVKRRILIGTYVLSAGYYDAYYKRAQKVRRLIANDFNEIFKECDVLLAPTSPTPAFKIGEKTDDPLKMYLNDIFTIPVNLAGLPAVAVPCGFLNNLPLSFQIIGKPWDELTILSFAHAYQEETDWHLKEPNWEDQLL